MTEQTVVKPAGTVDITRAITEILPAVDVDKMSVAEYANKLAVEARGETYVPPAAAATTEKPAAATQEKKPDAAATDDKTGEGDKQEAAADDDEDAVDPLTLVEETHQARTGLSKKFSKLTTARDKAIAEAAAKAAEAAEARKATDAANAEVARLKAEAEVRAAELAAIPMVPKAEDDPAPSRDAFDDPDLYEQAVIAHGARAEIRKANVAAETAAKTAKEAAAKKAQEAQQAKVQEQITNLHKTFNEKVTAAKAAIPDYDVKVTNNEKLILRNDVFFTIEQMDMPAHVLAHLADNPDVAAELNGMAPMAAAIKLGELQADIRIANKPRASQAKPPVTPVKSRTSPERKTRDEMSVAEYDAALQQEAAEARKRNRNPRIIN